MNNRAANQLADKLQSVLREAINTLEHAMFSIEIMRPLVSEKPIIELLNETYAANALNALTWTLYSQAAVDACKAIIDDDDRSASLATVAKLLTRPQVVAVLRQRRAAPVAVEIHHDGDLSLEERSEIEKRMIQVDQARAAREFDEGIPRALARFEEILKDPAVIRLKDVRNKILAHTDTVFDGEKYRRHEPGEYGLQWGDAEKVTKLGADLAAELMIGAFGHDVSIDDTRRVFVRYAEDFWRHLRAGLEVSARDGQRRPARAIEA